MLKKFSNEENLRGTRPMTASRKRPRRPGFTLVEILIVVVILGIMAMIVVPQFSNASNNARENTLKDDLRYLRTQILVYTAQHRDVPPGYPDGDTTAAPTEEAFIAQMTKFTDEQGVTSDTRTDRYRYGPYLSKMPTNPVANSEKIRMIADAVPLPAPLQGTLGWIYKPKTQEIRANSIGNDGNGVPYYDY